jgi:hypothetical protein
MAGANSNVQLTNLDFDSIKSNFINYLQGQSTFQDYNFEGSGLNVLLDVLAYNTQYNAYYLNQVANEMFLDSAVQRSSVVSQAKVLGYTPKSAIAPSATVNVVFTNVTTGSLTLPAYQSFGSASINGVNYTFTNPDSYTVNTISNTATFENVVIKQGVPATYSFTVDSSTNPKYLFEMPDASIDITTLRVIVQKSSANSSYNIYNPASNFLTLNDISQVYFTQESLNGNYQIYFGDGILGQKLTDGNIVIVNYLSTEGTSGAGANSFVLMNTVSGYAPSAVISVTPATAGGDKESIDSIKFQAPKSFSAQGRAVTKNDYITVVQENNLGISFDAVNVWGGEENNPPVYGQVFICLKPTGSYSLTATQKSRLISEVISPISVLTVKPTIVDPDYTYITLTIDLVYDPSKTTQTSSQINAGVTSAIQKFATNTLNTFNSSFNAYDLLNSIQTYDSSIITSDFKIKLQKKFFPNLASTQTYNFYYNTQLEKGVLLSGISNTPDIQFLNPVDLANTIFGVYIEEVPSSTFGVDTISVLNPGYSYQSLPNVTISGDGTGATAQAIVVGGAITAIKVTNSGNNYTSAIATITPQNGDTTGQGGAAVVNLQGRFGTLRTYYYNSNQVKTVLNSNIGSVDYINGIITLNNFNASGVNNLLGQLSITTTPTSSILSSTHNGIITIDPFDPTAITVNVTAKTNS